MRDFYKNKKVLITGHTGFKGAWLSKILISFGSDVIGYSLEPNTEPNLFETLELQKQMRSIIGDIRDLEHMRTVFEEVKPEIVFHLAAQPIVLDSYEEPVYTYEANVMGTVNVLECIRHCSSVKSVVNVTTDKVYQNNEWEWGYRENDRLCGYDPYSNSKSCSELVTHSYKVSFFKDRDIAVSTARAGNVIGGGDFANHRIIPDCIRAAHGGRVIEVRNPNSIRPYQHVLEPLFSYLMIAHKQWDDREKYEGTYNIGPEDHDCKTTGELTTIFCEKWKGTEWVALEKVGKHEANFLKLDCSKIKKTFGWKPTWNVEMAVEKTVEWAKAFYHEEEMNTVVLAQIEEFYELKTNRKNKSELKKV